MNKEIKADLFTMNRKTTSNRKKYCTFIKIDPSKEGFNIFVELGKIQNHIIESTRKLTEKSTRKSLIE